MYHIIISRSVAAHRVISSPEGEVFLPVVVLRHHVIHLLVATAPPDEIALRVQDHGSRLRDSIAPRRPQGILAIVAFSIPLQDIRSWRQDIRRLIWLHWVRTVLALVESSIIEEGVDVCESPRYGDSEEEEGKATELHGGTWIREYERTGRIGLKIGWRNGRMKRCHDETIVGLVLQTIPATGMRQTHGSTTAIRPHRIDLPCRLPPMSHVQAARNPGKDQVASATNREPCKWPTLLYCQIPASGVSSFQFPVRHLLIACRAR